MYAVLCTDGQMDAGAIIKECPSQKWAPIFAYYEKGVTYIPLFHDPMTARKFAKRNLPKDWLQGAVFTIPENIAWMENKGWKMTTMNFPRLMTGLPGITIGFEVMEFIEEPEIKVSR